MIFQRLVLALALLVGLASPAFGAIAFVQSAHLSEAGGATTAARAFGSNNTAGNFIVVGVGFDGTDTTATVTDTQGNTYTQAGTNLSVDGSQTAIFYAMDIAAGANTVTATWAASKTFRTLAIHEYSGVALTDALDDTVGQASAGTGTTATSGALTPAQDGSLLFGFAGDTASDGLSAGTDFTEREHDAGNWRSSEDFIQTTAASHAATWAITNNDNYTARLAIFKPPAVAGGAAPTRGLLGVGQ